MYFPSKKDFSVGLIIWGVVIISLSIYFISGEAFGFQTKSYKGIIGLVLTFITIGFLLSLWFRTAYKIEDGFIKIRYGPFKNTVIIREIKKISARKSLLATPVLSIDRISISHGLYNIAIVSPMNKNDFIKALITENSHIIIDKNLLYHHD